MPRVSVLVPSYRRPEALARCLAALAAQTRPADELIVGMRSSDNATSAVAESARAAGLPVRVAETARAGVVAAMQAALDAATGDVVALTDDDARPHPDWLAGLLAHFARSPAIGGVGGRDWQPWERGDASPVGQVQWFGRMIGNHHLGHGPARDVHVLKGVNCAFRGALLRSVGFDERLRGDGAQVHWELGVCLPLRRAGWRIVYDPAVAVDHDIADRHGADSWHRGGFAEGPLADAVHNETVELLAGRRLGWQVLFMAWALLVGSWDGPGVLQLLRLALRRHPHAVGAWRAAVRGRLAGWQTARRRPRALHVPRAPRA